jgi:CheY-like chemotaxis protein
VNGCAVPRYKLLLVDPHPLRLEAIAALLRGLGYGVTCATSVEQAQAVLALAKVDAVISISNAARLRRRAGKASARPTVAVAIHPPEDAPPGTADGVLRLPLRAPVLLRVVRRGVDALGDDGWGEEGS